MERTAIVVDDEPIIRLDISQMLEELGFVVAGNAADGFDAVELCRTHHPDVVLMDLSMPVFDGLDAAQTIIEEDLAGSVVIITAFDDKELIARANQIGVTGYLIKPVEQRLLLPVIEVAMAQSRRLAAAKQETLAMKQKLADQDMIDRAKFLLAKEQQVSEAEAYRELQRMAMDKRCSMAYLAQAVVTANSERQWINKAKALLMEKWDISEKAAYQKLQHVAKEKNLPLAVVARDILADKE